MSKEKLQTLQSRKAELKAELCAVQSEINSLVAARKLARLDRIAANVEADKRAFLMYMETKNYSATARALNLKHSTIEERVCRGAELLGRPNPTRLGWAG